MPSREDPDDLDDLVARCRGPAPRSHLREAIACLRAGSPRGCVLHTWAAIAADLLDKLRLLAAAGPAALRASLADRAALADAPDALIAAARERALLALAADAELVTPDEQGTLLAILHDRDAALHPGPEDPPPDLDHARTHLRTAVDLVLARHPIQGRHALACLWSDLASAFFPDDPATVAAFLRAGPLADARGAVVRDGVAELVRRAVEELHPAATRDRMIATVAALVHMHPTPASESLARVLPASASAVDDDRFANLVALLAAVPGSAALAGEAVRVKVAAFTARSAGAPPTRASTPS